MGAESSTVQHPALHTRRAWSRCRTHTSACRGEVTEVHATRERRMHMRQRLTHKATHRQVSSHSMWSKAEFLDMPLAQTLLLVQQLTTRT